MKKCKNKLCSELISSAQKSEEETLSQPWGVAVQGGFSRVLPNRSRVKCCWKSGYGEELQLAGIVENMES